MLVYNQLVITFEGEKIEEKTACACARFILRSFCGNRIRGGK